jgi:predicted HicB family RNase H-like nuclease
MINSEQEAPPKRVKEQSNQSETFSVMQELSQSKGRRLKMLTYKGYTGCLEIDETAGIIFGRILGIQDVVTFKGETVAEAKQAFQDSVDDYLAFCQELEQAPDKHFSGKLPFRITPEHHRKVSIAATKAGKSINAWMDQVLAQAADEVINSC